MRSFSSSDVWIKFTFCCANRRLSPVTALMLIMAGLPTGVFAADEAAQPNVLLIMVDDLGYGDLSSYGAADLRSPHIDGLMKRGMRFDNFYANCPVCSPTRASLLTGRYPELVGVPGVIRTHADSNWGYLDPDAVMLPSLMKKAGYHTAMVGKWHLGLQEPNTPTLRGFEHFKGYLGDMMDDYYKHRRHGINYMREGEQEIKPEGHATDLFTDWACEYLETRKDAEQPFFLYLAYNAPHTPIQPPRDWLAKVKEREDGITDQRAKLVALIEHMDHGIGKVLAKLKDAGLEESTLVIFTSDNGGQINVAANNGPLRDGKQSMYEGGLKVPMCVAWPGKVQPGSRSDAVAVTMDLFPSVVAAAGGTVENKIDGASLRPIWQGEKSELPARDLFFHRREGNARYQGLITNAIRRGDWKLLHNSPFAPLELYNLADDPQEQNDLANKNTKAFNELSAALRRQVQRGGAVPWQRPEVRDR